MDIESVLEVVKRWVEDETGPGFGYHIGHCDDLTHYYNMLRDMLKDADKEGLKEKLTGTAWNVDGSMVIEADKDWPNEWRNHQGVKVDFEAWFEENLDIDEEPDELEDNDDGC